ncbi:MAG TPA: FoF1 ATP synthase subunit gamma [Dokdonella sp.]
MSGELADVAERIDSTRSLGSVIGAMRGIAAARTHEARAQLDGVRAYARTIGAAIAQALALLPRERGDADAPRGAGRIVVALCAEQGFAGNFNERVLDAALAVTAAAPAASSLFVIGDRGLMLLGARGIEPAWSAPMAAHVDEVPALADRVADALYARIAAGTAAGVVLVHAQPTTAMGFELVHAPLLPFDYDRFAGTHAGAAPYVTLAPEHLVEQLAQEYVYAELCEALVLSFAAENEARMQAMVAAHANVEKQREALEAEFRRVRQSEITAEIVQLSSSRL